MQWAGLALWAAREVLPRLRRRHGAETAARVLPGPAEGFPHPPKEPTDAGMGSEGEAIVAEAPSLAAVLESRHTATILK